MGLLVHGQKALFHGENLLLKLHVRSRAVLLFHSSAGVAIGHGLLVFACEVGQL
jgi:hypothetical protein